MSIFCYIVLSFSQKKYNKLQFLDLVLADLTKVNNNDDDDDDDILFMLSNIIKYMQCTMKHEKKRDTKMNVKHAESIERVVKEKK